MKKLLALIAILACVACFTGCSADKEAAPAADGAVEQSAAETYFDEPFIRKLLDSIPAELMSKGKDAGYSLSTLISEHNYVPADESDPARPASYYISVSIESPIGSTHPDNDNVDIELMRDLLHAVVDSGIFSLSDEDKAALKANYYGAEEFEWELNTDGANLEIVETPSAYTALVRLSSIETSEPDIIYMYNLTSLGYEEGLSAFWEWDELQRRD